jgi:lysozyme
MLHGFDVSGYQSGTVPACDFAIIKATEGTTYTSSKFAAQWKSAKSKAAHRGAYHFARPENSSATAQATHFLSVVKPTPGESVWLDLEASDLNQAKTNAWAKAWGDHIRAKVPGVTSGVYLGSGYAANGTGRDLNKHFDFWWYPQYPSTARTSTWRKTFDPWLPKHLTCGWKAPHIWQWTDNFKGLDANLSKLTLDQLAGGELTSTEDATPDGG